VNAGPGSVSRWVPSQPGRDREPPGLLARRAISLTT
jgi:hypothetical protein